MNSKLHEAVAIFKALGWENVTAENILQLPIGSAEEKRTALAGLKSGEWGEVAQIRENTYGWRSSVDVEESKLALFAIRVGVDARRAVNIANGAYKAMLSLVIAARGAKYATDFITYACVSRRRAYEHSSSMFGDVAVQLVDILNLEIPQNVEYMKDWAVYAAASLGLPADLYNKENLLSIEQIQKRFEEHIAAGIQVNTPATGPFAAVLLAGVERSWLSRERAIELVFFALDASVRPGDRKAWLTVLDALNINDEELCVKSDMLIPILATGDAIVITRLAPVLIAGVKENQLSEVLMAALSAPTKKAKQVVLKAALSRSHMKNAEELAPWLGILSKDADKTIATLAERVMKQWHIAAENLPEENAEIRGFWQATPPVWQVPVFAIGETSPEMLTELAAVLINRPFVHDIYTEQFLAMAHAIACKDPKAARTSLRGLKSRDASLIDFIIHWIKEDDFSYGFDRVLERTNETLYQDLLMARDYMVALHLDKLPCLLSTPSMQDLSIRLSDLVERLNLYKKASADALEADLQLAVTRLDLSTKSQELIKSLKNLNVPIALQSGDKLPLTAGELLLKYLDDPIKEPALIVNKYGYWDKGKIKIPDSLHGLPNRFNAYTNEFSSIFPLWGDAAMGSVSWSSDVYHEKGLTLRQVARRAKPLPPGASINILAAQRSHTPTAAEDSVLAVTEAWERGLLRPGVADISLLDWRSTPPSNLAILSTAFEGIIQDGILSVVWPIIDALIAASLKAPRLLAGTAELVGLIAAYLPEVKFAVERGLADATALHLPGIRSLAGHSGSSQAVNTAKDLVTKLPEIQLMLEKEENAELTPFHEVWPIQNKALPPLDDGITITVESVEQYFCFKLTLPNISDRIFYIVKSRGWFYDLEREGQCQAYAAASDAPFTQNKDNEVWLHWDTEQNAMVICKHRNWAEEKNGPLSAIKAAPLPASLLIVLIGLLAQDGDSVYYVPRILRESIEKEQIGVEVVRRAMRTLLQSSVVSPAKLVRTLEKDIKLLPVFWPMLTEAVNTAGTLVAKNNTPPVWVNRILDVSLRYAPYLKEAAKRELIPSEDAKWQGLSTIASAKSKSTAIAKAKKLLAAL